MLLVECMPNRRNFLKGGVGMAVWLSTLAALPISASAAENARIVGAQPTADLSPIAAGSPALLDVNNRHQPTTLVYSG